MLLLKVSLLKINKIYKKFKNLFHKLNKIGKAIFLGIVLLFVFVLYFTFFSKSVYGDYVVTEWNGNKISSEQKIKIEKNKISGVVCGDWSGILTEKDSILSSQIVIIAATCDANTLGLQYSLIYGLQSGLQYSFKSGQVILLDGARNNTFVLKKS